MGDTRSALWYLPMSIALYLGMPILSIFCHRVKLASYQKLLMVTLVLSGTVIPSIPRLIALTGHTQAIHSVLKMNIFGASVWGESVWMIYLLAGYSIKKGKLKCVTASVLSILGIIVPVVIMFIIERSSHTVQHYDFILVVVFSISLFELLTRIDNLIQSYSYCKTLLTAVSKISFGVYMMHLFVGGAIYQLLKSMGMVAPIGKSFHGFVGIIFYLMFIAIIIIITYLIVLILKKNDFIKRYVLLMK